MTGSRRALLRGIASLVPGAVLAGLSGTVAGVGADSTPVPEPRGTDGGGTTLTATVDPSVHGIVGVPPSVDPLTTELRSRYPSIDPVRFGTLSTSLRIDGDRIVSGAAVAEGEFDGAALRSDLTADGVDIAGVPSISDPVSVPETPYAVGVDDTSIAVGYGPTTEGAVAHADSALRRGPSRDEGTPAALTGDIVSYATLGAGTRSYLLDHSDGSVAGLDDVLRAAEAFGVSLDVGEGRSDLRYGIVADPGALSAGDLWEFASRLADPDASIDFGSVSRHGRLLAVDATVETDRLWAAHERLFGSLSTDA